MFTPVAFFQTSEVTAPTLLLDTYTARAAYSVRKLRTAYTGDCLVVKRLSDNATQSIGFDANGNLDQSAMTSFCGTYSGDINVWYDQSGNGFDLTYITTPGYAQDGPRLVNSGVVATMSGCTITRPTTSWITGTPGLQNEPALGSKAFSNTQPATNFQVIRLSTNSLTNRSPILYDGFSASSPRHLIYNHGDLTSPNDHWSFGVTSFPSTATGSNTTTPRLFTALFNTTASSLRLNGTQILTGSLGSGTHTGLKLGNLRGTYPRPVINNYSWVGDISEVIFFQSDQSANYSAIETNINNYYGVY